MHSTEMEINGADIPNHLLIGLEQLHHTPIGHHQGLEGLKLMIDDRTFTVLHRTFYYAVANQTRTDPPKTITLGKHHQARLCLLTNRFW
jgi:hypothetical protein